jgi:hypothetical protein
VLTWKISLACTVLSAALIFAIARHGSHSAEHVGVTARAADSCSPTASPRKSLRIGSACVSMSVGSRHPHRYVRVAEFR